METFSALLAICAGNSPVPGEFPRKGQWRGALMFSLTCVWINGWVNIHQAGDLRRYRAHYDVTVRSHVIISNTSVSIVLPGGRFKNAYELLNLRALKIPMLYKNRIFQCMSKIFCVEFQRVPLKFHTKYLTHTLKDVNFIHRWNFKSS